MNNRQAVADEGEEGQAILEDLRIGLGGSVEETATVLGRTVEEIEAILGGEGNVDEDLEMKIREVAEKRKINLP